MDNKNIELFPIPKNCTKIIIKISYRLTLWQRIKRLFAPKLRLKAKGGYITTGEDYGR